MGDTRRYADRMALMDMTPRGELTSTGYALANPGSEYLILQPTESRDPISVQLVAGTYSAEWFSITDRKTQAADNVNVERDQRVELRPPFSAAGPSVLYLSSVAR